MPVYSNRDYVKIMRPLPQYVERDIYDIPVIEPQKIDISQMNNGLWLINMKNISTKDPHPKSKIVHSFCYDDTLFREYNRPQRYLERVSPYLAVTSFDFSMSQNMNTFQILSATYNNRWSGAYLQSYGLIVFPTVGWTIPQNYHIEFSGLRDGGIFIISTLGTNNPISKKVFLDGYYEMRNRFPNTQIICVGDKIDGMDSDVCFVLYEESFGDFDRKEGSGWQTKLFNWDMSISKGV